MSEDIKLDLDAIPNEEESDKDENFDGFEFIVELVEDDDDEDGEGGGEGGGGGQRVVEIETDDGPEEKREFFKYIDGFLSRSKQNQEDEEKKRKEELIEKKGLFKCSICQKFFLYRSKIHHHLVHEHGVDKGSRLNSWVCSRAVIISNSIRST